MSGASPGTVFAAATHFLKRMLGESLLCVFLTGLEDALQERRYKFVAVTDGVFSERSRRTVQGCELDFVVLPYAELSRNLGADASPSIVRMLAEAKPLYDAAALAAPIVGRAQAMLRRERRAQTSLRTVTEPVDLYRDLLATYRDDAASAELLAAEFVRASFALLLERRRQWPSALRLLFADVERCDSAAADLGRTVLSAALPWPKRLAAMRALYERCAGRELDAPFNANEPRVLCASSGPVPVRVTARRIDLAV